MSEDLLLHTTQELGVAEWGSPPDVAVLKTAVAAGSAFGRVIWRREPEGLRLVAFAGGQLPHALCWVPTGTNAYVDILEVVEETLQTGVPVVGILSMQISVRSDYAPPIWCAMLVPRGEQVLGLLNPIRLGLFKSEHIQRVREALA